MNDINIKYPLYDDIVKIVGNIHDYIVTERVTCYMDRHDIAKVAWYLDQAEKLLKYNYHKEKLSQLEGEINYAKRYMDDAKNAYEKAKNLIEDIVKAEKESKSLTDDIVLDDNVAILKEY